ncbi:3-methyladenine DNA glycosylase [Falsarthrobacter nasiphocae]|uniref:3-methyladenine DNA glycosylase/8-oxoguanine DNA glycosylase n=1 Tax=Falsarthrobacter nasiphocae TaxID=189863 RepID=A0AAE4C6S7_9MICC|nr:3-methyladenine DNA glycosylase [Falsarthrobacter nasiphocae]MDR6892477.1 3-methyladenine DNA glycosylase/8-oxoguanine DNA glycosylase [Falsarthrobacter nasiphocae]
MKPTVRTLRLPPGFSVRTAVRRLRWSSSDPSILEGGPEGTWLAFRTPDGPATLRILPETRGPDGRFTVRAGAWGPGGPWAAAHADELLGLADDWADFDDDVAGALPAPLAALRRTAPMLGAPRTRRVWDALFPSILGQRVTSIEARFAYTRLSRRYGDPAPGSESGVAPPGLRLPPTREAVGRIPSWEWHAAKVDRARAVAAMEAARAAGLERLADAEEPDAAARLRSLPGVGVWTAAETVQRSHAAKDEISLGDYHLAHHVGQVLLGFRVDDDGLLELLAPFAGHRQRVVRLVMASGIAKQAFGPRLSPLDHRAR